MWGAGGVWVANQLHDQPFSPNAAPLTLCFMVYGEKTDEHGRLIAPQCAETPSTLALVRDGFV
jgi:hypothetical protein